MATCKLNCKKGKVYMEAYGGFVDCPECSSIIARINPVDKDTEIYKRLNIPSQYENVGVAGVELFGSAITKNYAQASVNDVVNFIEQLNTNVYNKRVSQLSAYLFVGHTVDIRAFVYGLQKLAYERGLGVVPYISLNTLYGLRKITDIDVDLKYWDENRDKLKSASSDVIAALEGKRLMAATELTYFDYQHADVCILEATASTTERGWVMLSDILSERARNGLPTYVIGYWASYASRSSSLNYALANGLPRLDKLTPIEFKKYSEEAEVISQHFDIDTVTSKVQAGFYKSDAKV